MGPRHIILNDAGRAGVFETDARAKPSDGLDIGQRMPDHCTAEGSAGFHQRIQLACDGGNRLGQHRGFFGKT